MMSINHEEIRMHRLPIYRVTLVREGFQSLVMNCIKTSRYVFEIASGGPSRPVHPFARKN